MRKWLYSIIITCILFLAMPVAAVEPKDFDSWTLLGIVEASPNEIGLSWGIEPGTYTLIAKDNPENNQVVFLWGQEDYVVRYIVITLEAEDKLTNPKVYKYQPDGSYLLIWPIKPAVLWHDRDQAA